MTDIYLEIVADPLFWKIAIPALAAAILFALVWQRNGSGIATTLIRAGDSLGLGSRPAALIGFAFLTWGIIVLTLLIGLYSLIWEVIWQTNIAESEKNKLWNWRFILAQLAALTAVLGAIIALPVTLNRLFLARRQTETTENQLFNNKLNSATTDLAARHQVTREIGRGQQKRILTEWQDDPLTRAAAIDRLEGLAHERNEEAPRIARILSLYVRELTRLHRASVLQDGISLGKMGGWAYGLTPTRPDMESATQSIGRLQTILRDKSMSVQIDLRSANLQGFDLSNLQFNNARLAKAALEGANLRGAKLKGARLNSAKFNGTELGGADLQGAFLQEADLRSSYATWTNFQDADLSRAKLQNADLDDAKLQRARLERANLDGVAADRVKLQNANLGNAELRGAQLACAKFQGAFLGWANLEGANLEGAECQGADLRRVQFDARTNLSEASLHGAALRSVDLTNVPQIANHLGTMFGDGSVTLPGGYGPDHTDWPAHWPKETLCDDDFQRRWRDWQAGLDDFEQP